VVPLVHSVNKGFATTVCLFPPLPRALTADPWTPSLRRATPAVWRPTTAEKGTGARGIPRPTGVKLHPVTSPPEVIVTQYTGVPELADQIYCAFSLVITESNSVLKKGQGITDFL
jgi:hypothetical protein